MNRKYYLPQTSIVKDVKILPVVMKFIAWRFYLPYFRNATSKSAKSLLVGIT